MVLNKKGRPVRKTEKVAVKKSINAPPEVDYTKLNANMHRKYDPRGYERLHRRALSRANKQAEKLLSTKEVDPYDAKGMMQHFLQSKIRQSFLEQNKQLDVQHLIDTFHK
jgi:hypothetical protein